MSRIGSEPVKIEEGVNVEKKGNKFLFSGPKGELELTLPESIDAEIKEGEIVVSKKVENNKAHALWGTIRSLISNNVEGVKNGFEKKLELSGVGYRAKLDGEKLEMSLGWNHPIIVEPPERISFEVPDEVTIIVKGIDKQLVGRVASQIREYRKTEPYKGKGIKYEGENVRRKSPKKVAA